MPDSEVVEAQTLTLDKSLQSQANAPIAKGSSGDFNLFTLKE